MTSVGDPNRRLTPTEVAELHISADTDAQPSAIHHTIGLSGTQASPGNHTHNGRDSRTIDSLANPSTPVGGLMIYAATDPPAGWLICNGQAVSRETYGVLFAVIGLTYGTGDGLTTFNVPDMRDRFPVGAGSTYSLNTKGGSTTVALTSAQLASHSHSGSASSAGSHSHSASASSGTSVFDAGSHQHQTRDEGSGSTPGTAAGVQFLAAGAGTAYRMADSAGSHSHSASTSTSVSIDSSSAHSHTVSTDPTGSGTAHENRPPYIGLNFIIKF